MRKLFFIVFVLSCIACKEENKGGMQTVAPIDTPLVNVLEDTIPEVIVESKESDVNVEKEVCLIQLTDATWIKNNLSEVHALSDKCKEAVMLGLKNNALASPKLLSSIDAVNFHSQGNIKEEVWYMMQEIYEKKLPDLAGYLYENKDGSLSEALMTALSMTTAEDSPDLVEDRFVRRINAEVMDEKVKQYMLSLKTMFNFQMFN